MKRRTSKFTFRKYFQEGFQPKRPFYPRAGDRRLRVEQFESRCMLAADSLPDDDTFGSESSVTGGVNWFASFDHVARLPLEQLARVDNVLPAGVAGPIAPAVGEWIVQLRESIIPSLGSLTEVERLLHQSSTEFQVIAGLGEPGKLLLRGQGIDRVSIEASLSQSDVVASFSLNQLVRGQATASNDPELVGGLLTGLDRIGSRDAWDVSRGSSRAVVGVVDTGIDTTHPDLYLNVWLNQGELPPKYLDNVGPKLTDIDNDGLITFYDLNNVTRSTAAPFGLTFGGITNGPNASFVVDRNANSRIDAQDLLADPNWADGRDTDNNGFFDDLFGVNFRAGAGDPFASNNPSDELGHGTHVAGTIGAIGNNTTGVVGVNWQTSLMSLRILDNNNQGDTGSAIRAVNYARMMRELLTINDVGRVTAGAEVRVLNNSWGQPGGYEVSLEAAIGDLGEAGVLFVAAAGNGNILGQGVDNDRTPFYPASYTPTNVIAVAASDGSDRLAPFSNFGKKSVDLLAPGVGIRSTLPGGAYGVANGTSMATPHVSGSAALIWSAFPEATVDEIKAAILSSVDFVTNASELVLTGGRLNVAKAVNADVFAPSAKVIAKQNITTAGGTSTEFTVQYFHRNGIDASTIGNDDLIVLRQWGATEPIGVSLKPNTISATATTMTATYVMAAPGGSWDPLDFGDYEIQTVAVAVQSTLGDRAAQVRSVGSFNVRISDPGVIYVGSFSDDPNSNTLRDAVIAANSSGQPRTIILEAGKYNLETPRSPDSASTFPNPLASSQCDLPLNTTGWSNQHTGDLDVTGNIRIVGNQNDLTTIDGQRLDRIFKVHPGATLVLDRVTLTGGSSPSDQGGGGILSAGTLELNQTILRGNESKGNDRSHLIGGGGIAVWDGTAAIHRSWIDRNEGDFGAAIFACGNASVSIDRSTISGNIGGGIHSHSFQNVLMENSTLSGNTGGKGSIFNGKSSFEGNSYRPAVSADGKFVAFESESGTLVPGDNNSVSDIFVYENATGRLERVSVALDGGDPNSFSFEPTISADGRYVAFRSHASNLVANDSNGGRDIFVFDRLTRATSMVSVSSEGVQANEGSRSESPALSENGRFVAFWSDANNLVPSDTNDSADVFVRDLVTNTTERISLSLSNTQIAGSSFGVSISGDGRFVTFETTANNVLTGDTDGIVSVFLRDRTANTTRYLADGENPFVSGDGLFVAFSSAQPIAPNDTNNVSDIYLVDLTAGLIDRVSKSFAGAQGNAESINPRLSHDGRYLAFLSNASNLVGQDTNAEYDVFLRDRITRNVVRVPSGTGSPGIGFSNPSLDAAGRIVALDAPRDNPSFSDSNGLVDIFVYDTLANSTLSTTLFNAGNFVGSRLTIAETQLANYAVAGKVSLSDTLLVNSIFDLSPGTTQTNTITKANAGFGLIGPLEQFGRQAPVHPLLFGNPAIDTGSAGLAGTVDQLGTVRTIPDVGAVEAIDAAVSGFVYADINQNQIRDADELLISGVEVRANNAVLEETDQTGAFSVRALSPGATTIDVIAPPFFEFGRAKLQIIPPAAANNTSGANTAPSADGRFVVFESDADNLVPNDTNSTSDIFLHDRLQKTTVRINRSLAGTQANDLAFTPVVSSDARYIAFISLASNLVLGDTNSVKDVFLFDRVSGVTERINLGPNGVQANQDTINLAMSADGRFIAYHSFATNLVANDTNGVDDIFVYDRILRTTVRVPIPRSTSPFTLIGDVHISGNGRYVSFYSTAANIVAGDTNNEGDVFVYDRNTSTFERVSVTGNGSQLVGGSSNEPSLSYDGRYVAYESSATNVVPGDTNGKKDIFLFDRTTRQVRRVSQAINGTQANDQSFETSISGDGRYVGFSSFASNLVPNDTNGNPDVFVFDSLDGELALASLTIDGLQAISAGSGSGSSSPKLSSDGRFLTFLSSAPNLVPGDTNQGPDGFFVANPLADAERQLTLRAGEQLSDVNFGIIPQPGDLAGRVFNDVLPNGAFDEGEPGFSDAIVFLDLNGDGLQSTDEPAKKTDSQGNYRFQNVSSFRSYSVKLKPPAGFEVIAPSIEQDFANVVFLPAGGAVANADFALRMVQTSGQSSASSVSGRLYDDRNGDKIFTAGVDVPMVNREVYLDASNFGVRDVDEPRTLTDANGFYTIDGLSARNVAVTAVLDETLKTFSPLGSSFSLQKFPLYNSVRPFANPQAIASADFNADGFLDVAVVLGEANRLSIRLNDKQGGFLPDEIEIDLGASGIGPTSLVVGQFDADTRLDAAVVANYSGRVIVLLNYNAATKTFTSLTPVTVGLQPLDIVAGQFAGDSRLDLAVVNRGGGSVGSTVQILTNNGSGVFTAGAAVPTGGKTSVSIVTGNFVGDASLDLGIVHASPAGLGTPNGGVTILRGNGAGGLTLDANYYEVGAFPIDASVADFNGDGRADIAVSNFSSNSISILLGQVNGTLRTQASILGTASGAFDITVGDIDNDSDFDVVASNLKDRNVSIFRNVGVDNVSGDVRFEPLENIGLGQFSAAQRMPLVLGNFDKDTSGPGGTGTLDIVTIPQLTDTLHVLRNKLVNGSFRVALSGTNTVNNLDFRIQSAVLPPSFNIIANPLPILEDAPAQQVAIGGIVKGRATGPNLAFSAVSSVPSLIANPTITYVGGSTATLNFTPVANASGVTVITVFARDAGADLALSTADDGLFSRSFTVTVLPVNDPPTIAFPLGRSVNTIKGGQARTIDGFLNNITRGGGTAEVAQTLSAFALTAANPSLFTVQPAIDVNGRLTFTGKTDVLGATSVQLVLRDNGGTANGGSDTLVENFFINFTPLNSAPSVSVRGSQSATVGAALRTIPGFAFNFNPGGVDGESTQSVLEYLVTNDAPSLFSTQPTVDVSGTLRFTPSNTAGTAKVTLRVRDNGGTIAGGIDLSAPITFPIVIFPTTASRTTIDLSNGGSSVTTIFGADPNDQSGFYVAGAGDVNGDGFEDTLVGARFADALNNAKSDAGETYLIFGTATPPSSIDLATLGAAGVTIFGTDAGDQSGRLINSAGDVNGDGFDDLLVGSIGAGAAGNAKTFAGESYIIFGKAAMPTTIDLASLGTNGVTIFGVDTGDLSGKVSSAGDVNGDGFQDILIGAQTANGINNAKADVGDAYLVYGARTMPTTIDLATLSPTVGVRFFGIDAGDRFGVALSSAGDVNGDGLDDLLISAANSDGLSNAKVDAGETYIVFGSTLLPSSFDVTTLGAAGVTIFGIDTGDFSGRSVSGAGDINGDGFEDILIGVSGGDGLNEAKPASGESYVVFGRASLPSTINLSTLGAAGITLFGVDKSDFSGVTINRAGDVNADGFDDLVIGAVGAASLLNSRTGAGESYLVFGSATLPSTVDLATLGNVGSPAGVTVLGVDINDQSGFGVGGFSDFNGDGFSDLMIGAAFADGLNNAELDAGESYIVYGGNSFTSSVTQLGTINSDVLTGNTAANIMVGGRGNDTLIGNGGLDVLIGGQGNDTIAISDLSFRRIDGGTGFDTLRIDAANLILNLSSLSDSRLQDIEQIDLTGIGANTLVLNRIEVAGLSGTWNTLIVRGNAGDRVEIDTGWTRLPDQVVGSETFQFFNNGILSLRVLAGVTVLAGLELSTLGSNGLRILGTDAGDQAGYSVSGVGDINGDGFEDILIGARFGDSLNNARADAGEAYVVFGSDVPPTTIDLTNLGIMGVTIFGIDQGDQAGNKVSRAGDVNGDGFDDLLVSATAASASSNAKALAGESYLIFGRAVLPTTINLAALGTSGVTIFGSDANDLGARVSTAGDVNGDGFDDIIIGVEMADGPSNTRTDSGESYLLFGSATFPSSIDLATLGIATGIRIFGAGAGDRSGVSINTAGDVNGDGLDDLVIGAWLADASGNTKSASGDSYVVFGSTAFPTSIDLNLLGALGVTIFGADLSDGSGRSISGVGDVNGDGFGDILVGALGGDGLNNTKDRAGESYLIFGGSSLPQVLDLANLGAAGVTIFGSDQDDSASEITVAAAGDINADGYDDLLIGAPNADGSTNARANAGEAYVVFGGPSLPSTIDLNRIGSALGVNGFAVFGVDANDQTGFSLSGNIDFNGDGFEDFILGLPFADGLNNAEADAGESYIVFGSNRFTSSVTHSGTINADTLVGTTAANIINGNRGSDLLIGNGNADVLIGGQGNDTLAISDVNFRRVVGGTGGDTLRLVGAGITLNLTTIRDSRLQGIEAIDLTGSGNNTLIVNAREIVNLSERLNLLIVRRNAGDVLTMLGTWSRSADQTISGILYEVYRQGAAVIFLQAVSSGGSGEGPPTLTNPTDTNIVQDALWISEASLTTIDFAMLQDLAEEIDFTQSTVSPLRNVFDPHDVNQDGLVTALDVLVTINALRRFGNVVDIRTTGSSIESMVDVNGDFVLTPLDVLQVINRLNRRTLVATEPTDPKLSVTDILAVDQVFLDEERLKSVFDE